MLGLKVIPSPEKVESAVLEDIERPHHSQLLLSLIICWIQVFSFTLSRLFFLKTHLLIEPHASQISNPIVTSDQRAPCTRNCTCAYDLQNIACFLFI